ncbi:MAG: hypothetical protein RIF41_26455 [Polyangiaceae bacterium]
MTGSRTMWLGAAVVALCVACGDSGASSGAGGAGGAPGTGGSGTGTGTGTGNTGGGPSGGTYSVTMGPIDVQPGVENTQCVIMRLGNPEPIKVGRIHNNLELSHHLIVYTSSETEEVLEPFDCSPFLDTLDPTKGSPLMVSQKAEDTLQLPDGVGFALEANQMLRLELHYINASTAPQSITATSEMTTLTEGEFQDEAGFLFVGNPDISIPPMSSATLGPTFFAVPADYADVSFFAITGHTHQWGTDVRIDTADANGAVQDSVYAPTDFDWEQPPTVVHDPVFTLPQDGGFSFTCEWNNMSNQTVSFGESANQEMCFFWAYYYPNKGPKVCFHTDQLPGGFDLCCPGDAFCDQLF